MTLRRGARTSGWLVTGLLLVGLVQPVVGTAAAEPDQDALKPTFGTAAAFDVSPAVSDIAGRAQPGITAALPAERGPAVPSDGFGGDAAVQSAAGGGDAISPPIQNFEGIANVDNPGLVSPPDPIGDVGPNHYVEMVNVTFAIYSKTGTVLTPPTPLGNLWSGFAIPDCTDESGDPVVVHDQLANRWILTQFTTRGPTYYNCVAISTTANPTGTYFRYAFSTGNKFPDYPKYGVWPDAYYISTREFNPDDTFFGVGAYALNRAQMLVGNPNAQVVHFNVAPGATPYLPGDGLLPTDLDGKKLPPAGTPNYFLGTQDDEGPYGAPFDAINMWEFSVNFANPGLSTFVKSAQLPVPEFDSAFPCGADGRSCIGQPTVTQKIDVLSYRQRPTWRLAYRNFGRVQSLVTNQSVEARPGVAGVRWYEIRRPANPTLFQASTFSPNDGVNRWMGSVAMDKFGNMAAGYSVSNSTSVFPGIRYTGRLQTDPKNTLPQGEQVLIAGTGSQTGSPRWGDYTSLNVDPRDDCTFWYVNEYVQTTGQVRWQTRIGSFRFPGCGA